MQGSLGEKIGEGAYAGVYAWAPGRVLKLFKPGFPQRVSWWEARVTRAAAGFSAPEVFDEVIHEGRFGIVFQRLGGPTLLKLSRSGAMTLGETGAILANLAIAVHKIATPPEVISLYDSMSGSLGNASGALPGHIATGILAWIEHLAPADGLCHGDLHPGNVIMTAGGARLIDWIGAVRAPPAFELAGCHVLLSELAPDIVDDPERPRAVNAAVQSEYARLTGMAPAALMAAMEPYLPIMRVRALLGPAGSLALQERLIQSVELALGSRD